MSTLLSYTKSAFTPFTKIVSADMNQYFTDIKNRLNWAGGSDTTTGLSGDNIQVNSVPLIKLAGQPFNIVLGSAAQVTAGTATHSSFSAYVQADGDRVLILPGYSTSEAWTITRKLVVEGLGNTSQVQGAITLNSGANYCRFSGFRTTANFTISSGVVGVFVNDVWFSGTNTFVDNNSTPASNLLFGMQE